MRIGVVTTSYPRWPGDHAGNFVAAHVDVMRRAGHIVEVIAASDSGASGGGDPDDAVERVPGADLFYTGGAPDYLERSPLRGAYDAAAFSARLAAAVARRASTWDAIVAHWLAPSALAVTTAYAASPLTALRGAVASIPSLRRLPLVPALTGFIGQLAPTKKPLLAIAHGGDIHTLRRAGLLAPALHALHSADARIVFVSEELREIAERAAPRLARWLRSARVQPMGIDGAHFASLPRSPTTPPTIACVARLTPVKGIDVLIDALPYITSPVRVEIAGDGPELAQLLRRAERLLSTTATHIEFVSGSERDRLLSIASVVVVPSRVVAGRSEGAPLIAIEAMAAGVPVVASAVGGLREIPGLVTVAPDDPRALAAAIDTVLATIPDPAAVRGQVADRDWSVVGSHLMPAW